MRARQRRWAEPSVRVRRREAGRRSADRSASERVDGAAFCAARSVRMNTSGPGAHGVSFSTGHLTGHLRTRARQDDGDLGGDSPGSREPGRPCWRAISSAPTTSLARLVRRCRDGSQWRQNPPGAGDQRSHGGRGRRRRRRSSRSCGQLSLPGWRRRSVVPDRWPWRSARPRFPTSGSSSAVRCTGANRPRS